jgi:hypothetical protein
MSGDTRQTSKPPHDPDDTASVYVRIDQLSGRVSRILAQVEAQAILIEETWRMVGVLKYRVECRDSLWQCKAKEQEQAKEKVEGGGK